MVARRAKGASPYDRVREICLALPGVYEKEAWSAPTFRVERGKMFLMFADNHHGDGRVSIWLMATPDARETLVAADPDTFFVPPYVGPSGWIGACVDGARDWGTIASLIEEAHRLGSPAPKVPRVKAKKKVRGR
jgi:predicted DNA-binding protein (MmcQ/YjbR family)